VTPDEAKLLKAGQAIQVRLSDEQTFPGRVTHVSDQLQRATGSAEVLVEISNPPDGMAVGQFVPAAGTMESGAAVVTIPRAALLGCSEGQFVYTVSGEHLVRTAVKVGASNAEFVEIADGLYTGDEVVLQPVMSLWMTELAAVKGGQACCIEPPKGK
jgi:multidrug efflux pump subunit AcrA (membrane-fusion protein)